MPVKRHPLPSKQDLDFYFNYNPDTGIITWNASLAYPYSGVAGKEASQKVGKYKIVELKGKRYLHQRIAWVIMTGNDPEEMFVDHIDRDPSNNKWNNLRLATASNNTHNAKRITTNYGNPITKPYKNVYKSGNKWCSIINCNHKRYWLGMFDTPEEARDAYNAAATKLHGVFASLA